MSKSTKLPPAAEWASPKELPPLRKRPNQSRSRALVEAVAQASLRILDEGGDEALTVTRIAELSGAAVGSIYQYFPNKDAIVALLYERVLDEESEHLRLMQVRLVGMPLATALREILANIIRVELRLFKLNQVFICATTTLYIWVCGADPTKIKRNSPTPPGCPCCKYTAMTSPLRTRN